MYALPLPFINYLQLIISSDPPSSLAEQNAKTNAIPIFTQAWLHDCLLLRKFVTDSENPAYVYNSSVPITAYSRLKDFWPPGAQHTCLLDKCTCKRVPTTPARGKGTGRGRAGKTVLAKETPKKKATPARTPTQKRKRTAESPKGTPSKRGKK